MNAHTKIAIRTPALAKHIGQQITISGWLHATRRLGGITFLILRDGWGMVQAVTEDESVMTPLREAEAGPESIIELSGRVVTSEQAPGGLELHAPSITIINPVKEMLPAAINKRELKANLPTLLDHAAVLNRHPKRKAIFRLAAAAMQGFRDTLRARQFSEVQTPKLVASATEGGANVFPVTYFEQTAYLAQSPQFYKQIMVGVFERVFEVGPVFRAEQHNTSRHINEYVSLDVEMGFIENHFTVMALLQEVIAGMLSNVVQSCSAELERLDIAIPQVPGEIPNIHFAEAQSLVTHEGGINLLGEADLTPDAERWLGHWASQHFGSDFLFVTGYPMSKRPFYTHPEEGRPEFSNSFDLLFRGTELVTGGQRLHHYAAYQQALAAAGLPEAPFASYLEAFKYGMPPHGGFAIGLERFLMQLLNLPNIRLATLFPRDLNRLTP